jgi:predicted O-methyltransferase YrrM
MTAQSLLDEIYATRTVTTESGEKIPLHSEIPPESGGFLRTLVRENHSKDVLEIGCAYGLSTLFIEDGLMSNRPARHVVLDPMQHTDWRGVGMANLTRAGFNSVELIEEYSEFALPALLKEGRQFDFAFIDGWHTMDHALLDFFYVNRMLREGGIVVFDDAPMPPVGKAIQYVSKYPNYRFLRSEASSSPPTTWRRSVKNAMRGALRPVVQKVFGSVPSTELPPGRLLAFQKTGPDQRDWNWYEPF